MEIRNAYNLWAEQYDTNENKTRDLESAALREIITPLSISSCLEAGCGTGKNTIFFAEKCNDVLSVDLSEGMLAKAKEKISSPNVNFQQVNMKENWGFVTRKFDLVSFSLVLEHIEDLDHIFSETSKAISGGGYVYVGELHPFKQYAGSKARFAVEGGEQTVECYNHHISDFTEQAKKYGLEIELIREYFDEVDRNNIPRILAILFRKK